MQKKNGYTREREKVKRKGREGRVVRRLEKGRQKWWERVLEGERGEG